MKVNTQISETLGIGMILALSGGFMDAYSYICRGEVFANAQTGNILLFGVHLSQGQLLDALRYVTPVFAFVIGIALADIVRVRDEKINRLHWRQLAVFVEAIVLLGVGFIPQSLNLLANSLTSFACGIQVESFRKIHGNGIATTMCIGNLRSGTQHMCSFRVTQERAELRKGLLYYGIIVCFAVGAVLGNVCIHIFSSRAIFVCSIILMLVFFVMFIDLEHQKKVSKK